MPSHVAKRFYFDLTNGQTTLRDETGVEATSLNEALEQARAAIDEMRDNGELDGLGRGWQLIIRDERGAVVQREPIA